MERTYTGESRQARVIDGQTGPFLRELVALVRPMLVIECGTFPGTATAFLVDGLGPGARLVTYERDERLYPEVTGWSRPGAVEVVLGEPDSFAGAELAFIDSGPAYADRVRDVECWLATADAGAIAVIDDAYEAWFAPFADRPGIILPSDHGLAVWRR